MLYHIRFGFSNELIYACESYWRWECRL